MKWNLKKSSLDENVRNNNIITTRGGTLGCKWHRWVSYVGNNIGIRVYDYNNVYAKQRPGDTRDNILLWLLLLWKRSSAVFRQINSHYYYIIRIYIYECNSSVGRKILADLRRRPTPVKSRYRRGHQTPETSSAVVAHDPTLVHCKFARKQNYMKKKYLYYFCWIIIV